MNPQNYSLVFKIVSKHENPLSESSWQNHMRFVAELNQTDNLPCADMVLSIIFVSFSYP